MPEDANALASLNADVQKLHADSVPWFFKQPIEGVFYAPAAVPELLADQQFFEQLGFTPYMLYLRNDLTASEAHTD